MGAVAIALTSAGDDDAQSVRERGAERSRERARAASEGERSKESRGEAEAARREPDGSSSRDSGRLRRGSRGGDTRAALPRDLVRELRRRKIPVIELEPGKGPGLTGGREGGEQLDPRALRKLLEQKER